MRHLKISGIMIAIIIGIVVLLIIPFKIPHSVKAQAKIVGLQEWTLTMGNNGELMSTLRNNLTGTSNSYVVSSVSGDGNMSFSLNESILNGEPVIAGDTVGYLRSSELERRLVVLQGELVVAQASLAVNASGEKPAVIKEIKQELQLAKAEAEQQKRIVSRLESLHDRELVSKEEYEIANSELNILDLEVSVAKARFVAATSGAKAEDTTLIRVEIESIQEEINILQLELAAGVLISPVSGYVSRVTNPDNVITISDSSSFIAVMVLERKDYTDVLNTDSTLIYWSSAEVTGKARLLQIDREIQILQGHEVVIATAEIEDAPRVLLPGTVAECTITCKPKTLLKHISHFLGIRSV